MELLRLQVPMMGNATEVIRSAGWPWGRPPYHAYGREDRVVLVVLSMLRPGRKVKTQPPDPLAF